MLDAWVPETDLVSVDEIVTIRMHGECILIAPMSVLDTMRTHVFVDALNAAGLAGSVVMLSARPDDPPPLGDFPLDEVDGEFPDVLPVEVEPVLAGIVRVPVGDLVWTIDVTEHRFIRTDTVIDVRFLVETDWTPYTTMWFTPTSVTAATTSGSYVMGPRPRRTTGPGHRPDRPLRAVPA